MVPFTPWLAVFSAHAEVVPCSAPLLGAYQGILRARGGSSVLNQALRNIAAYSPRTRR